MNDSNESPKTTSKQDELNVLVDAFLTCLYLILVFIAFLATVSLLFILAM